MLRGSCSDAEDTGWSVGDSAAVAETEARRSETSRGVRRVIVQEGYNCAGEKWSRREREREKRKKRKTKTMTRRDGNSGR